MKIWRTSENVEWIEDIEVFCKYDNTHNDHRIVVVVMLQFSDMWEHWKKECIFMRIWGDICLDLRVWYELYKDTNELTRFI